ncbi:MAG: DUF4340 domain-containing protein [Phycisphaerales bacterium]
MQRRDGGEWDVILGSGGAESQRWALVPTAAHALLRRLVEARAIATPSDDDIKAGIGADATTVLIEFDNGGMQTLSLAARTLGDHGLVEVGSASGTTTTASKADPTKPMLAVVDSSLHRVFREPGPKGWRETRVFAGLGQDISRVRMDNVNRHVTLGRVNGTWALVDPVAAPADPERVRKLITTLGELAISSFFDDAPPPTPTTGLDKPIVTIAVESESRIIDEGPGAAAGIAKTATTTRTLLVGNPSDGTGQRRYAALAADGPVFVIDSAALSVETFTPTAYIAPSSLSVAPADVGGVVMTPPAPTGSAPADPAAGAVAGAFPRAEYTRTLDGWSRVEPGGSKPLSDDEARQVNELLSFLQGEGPRSIELTVPGGWSDRGSIELRSLGGAPLMMLVIGSAPDGSLGTRVTDVKGRDVFRVYSPGRSPGLLSGTAAAAKRETEAASPLKTPGDGDILK